MFCKVLIFVVSAVIAVKASGVPVAPVLLERHAPQPYSFGYNVRDENSQQFRQETSDGHVVRGTYGGMDTRGVQRQVNYIADHNGFRAEVRTNEPGTANQNPASVRFISTAPKPFQAPVVAPIPVVNKGAVYVDNLGYDRYGH